LSLLPDYTLETAKVSRKLSVGESGGIMHSLRDAT
jgi:hypothetical protein